MSNCRMRTKSSRRYVRLLLEELELRYVPSLMGLQINLPLPAALPSLSLPVGMGTAHGPALTTTSAPGSTQTFTLMTSQSQGPASTSPSLEIITVSFTPTTAGNPSAGSAAGSSTGVSQLPASTSNQSGAGTGSPGSSSAFSQGTSQTSSVTFSFPGSAPAASAPALGIQVAFPGSSAALGGTVTGGALTNAGFELLGNLTWLLGPVNAQLGTANTALSTSSLAGSPLAGSAFYRPNLLTDQTTGELAARGLMHPAPGNREEQVPEQFLIPPDQDWFEPVPQNIEQTIPDGNVQLRTPANFPFTGWPIAPQPDAGNARIADAPAVGMPEDIFFDDEDMGLPADDEQPEEQEHSGVSAAVAIISAGAGAFLTTRNRGRRKTADAAQLPEIEEMIR